MELVENYENLVKSMVPMECMEPVISGVWDTTAIIRGFTHIFRYLYL